LNGLSYAVFVNLLKRVIIAPRFLPKSVRSVSVNKKAGPVSRVLYPHANVRISVIYLRRQSPAASSNLPPGIGRATLLLSSGSGDRLKPTDSFRPLNKKPVYTVLQPTGRTAGGHRSLRGGLLPRLFTLTRPVCAHTLGRAVVFCYAPIPSRVSSRLACVVLCVARTFLSRLASAATERACGAKVMKNRVQSSLPAFFIYF